MRETRFIFEDFGKYTCIHFADGTISDFWTEKKKAILGIVECFQRNQLSVEQTDTYIMHTQISNMTGFGWDQETYFNNLFKLVTHWKQVPKTLGDPVFEMGEEKKNWPRYGYIRNGNWHLPISITSKTFGYKFAEWLCKKFNCQDKLDELKTSIQQEADLRTEEIGTRFDY